MLDRVSRRHCFARCRQCLIRLTAVDSVELAHLMNAHKMAMDHGHGEPDHECDVADSPTFWPDRPTLIYYSVWTAVVLASFVLYSIW